MSGPSRTTLISVSSIPLSLSRRSSLRLFWAEYLGGPCTLPASDYRWVKQVCFEDECNSLGPLRTLVTLRPQVRQPGNAVWTHGGVEGPLVGLCVPFRLPCACRESARLTCVAHVLKKTEVFCEGQLSVSVLWVSSRLRCSLSVSPPDDKSRRVVLCLWVPEPE